MSIAASHLVMFASKPRCFTSFMDGLPAGRKKRMLVHLYNSRNAPLLDCTISYKDRGWSRSSKNTGNSASAWRFSVESFSPEVSKYCCTCSIRSRLAGITKGGAALGPSAWITFSTPTLVMPMSATCSIAAIS